MMAPPAPVDRLPDWPEQLAAFIERRWRLPFDWAANNCASFAADAAQAVTGVDLLGALRSRWTDEASARALVAELGGLRAAASALLGEPMANMARAQRGDVVLIELPDGGAHIAVCTGVDWRGAGGTRGPMTLASCAWAVGRVA